MVKFPCNLPRTVMKHPVPSSLFVVDQLEILWPVPLGAGGGVSRCELTFLGIGLIGLKAGPASIDDMPKAGENPGRRALHTQM